ncbi:hypothetical protein PYW08_006514 [Mythimna loreyi]|uniref:Uncharacterized protein n=1 Tax=Mythimna loreyi TaxID=667449 RepID=A0ACC2QQE9_9NEOP|nr:hypothetical protein PYW08_006514 [Mythimna loreyi]
MIFVFLLAFISSTTILYTDASYIVVYGDVHKDVEFFTRTFPWIVDNIGGHLFVDYNLLGSGRYSVPQACALSQLRSNTFLQAAYLRCEALGYPSEYCLCEAAVDPEHFKQCVVSESSIAGEASWRFTSLGVNETPVVDLRGVNNTVYGTDDVTLLKKICGLYDQVPRGCINYSSQTEGFLEYKALAQFDRQCFKEFPLDDDDATYCDTPIPGYRGPDQCENRLTRPPIVFLNVILKVHK